MLLRKLLPLLFFFFLMTAGTVNASVAVPGHNPPKEKSDSLTEAQIARIKAWKTGWQK
jgi:hypothetical protein